MSYCKRYVQLVLKSTLQGGEPYWLHDEFQLEVCRELKFNVLKEELAHLRESMYTRSTDWPTPSQDQPSPICVYTIKPTLSSLHRPTPICSQFSLHYTTWNCGDLASIYQSSYRNRLRHHCHHRELALATWRQQTWTDWRKSICNILALVVPWLCLWLCWY